MNNLWYTNLSRWREIRKGDIMADAAGRTECFSSVLPVLEAEVLSPPYNGTGHTV